MQPINLWKLNWISIFAIIEELENWKYIWELRNSEQELIYKPTLEFDHYIICEQNLRDRFDEMIQNEFREININIIN